MTVGGHPFDPGRVYTVTGNLALALVAEELARHVPTEAG